MINQAERPGGALHGHVLLEPGFPVRDAGDRAFQSDRSRRRHSVLLVRERGRCPSCCRDRDDRYCRVLQHLVQPIPNAAVLPADHIAVKARKTVAADRHRGQRGSVLSSVLIIVAFMSILVGALMTELTDSFLVSRTANTRVEREATVTSAVELAIHQLQTGSVPHVCARDVRGPLVPDTQRKPGGRHPDVHGDRSRPGDRPGSVAVSMSTACTTPPRAATSTSSARRPEALSAYTFGQTSLRWSIPLGGAVTAPPLAMVDADGAPDLLVPAASSASGCGGHCVELLHYSNAVPSVHCTMPAGSSVMATPAVEVAPGSRNFPDYTFFAGAGGSPALYVYDAAADHSCPYLASAALGGGPVGPPLVFPGVANVKHNASTRERRDLRPAERREQHLAGPLALHRGGRQGRQSSASASTRSGR